MKIPTTAPPDVQQALREVWTTLDRVMGPGNVDLKGRRIINAGGAIDPFDYVHQADVDTRIADAIAALDLDTDTVVFPPPLLYGTHAEKIAKYGLTPGGLQFGTLYWETDRTALYYVGPNVISGNVGWLIMLTRPMRDTYANRPTDLTVNDAGFLFHAHDQGVIYELVWVSPSPVWYYRSGQYVTTFANRPLATITRAGMEFVASDRNYQVWRSTGAVWTLLEGTGGPHRDAIANRPTTLGANDGGYRFQATDQGNHVWRWSGTAWVLLPGVGGPMFGTLSPDQKPTLGANDAGFRFSSTDFAREYTWSGSAWADSPGAPARYQLGLFLVAPGTGWERSDGDTVTISVSDGSTTNYATTDLVTDNYIVRTAAAVGSGVDDLDAGALGFEYYNFLPYVRL